MVLPAFVQSGQTYILMDFLPTYLPPLCDQAHPVQSGHPTLSTKVKTQGLLSYTNNTHQQWRKLSVLGQVELKLTLAFAWGHKKSQIQIRKFCSSGWLQTHSTAENSLEFLIFLPLSGALGLQIGIPHQIDVPLEISLRTSCMLSKPNYVLFF